MPLHIDPKVATNIKSQLGRRHLLKTLLHEIAQAWGYADHANDTPETDYAGVPYFGTLQAGWCIQ